MGPIAVAILDRDDWGANTDILVLVDPRRKQLLWIPRDLWSPLLGDRINAAFAKGGGRLLIKALHRLGFACSGVLCLSRSATEAALLGVTVTVPVKKQLDFWYPLHPTRPIEEGRKQVTFMPPEEMLSGERLHQWIGARYAVGAGGSDLYRINRQKMLLKALLRQGFDFSMLVGDPHLIRQTGRDVLPVLGAVRARWEMATYDRLKDATIKGKQVLVPIEPLRPIPPLWRRVLRRLKRLVLR